MKMTTWEYSWMFVGVEQTVGGININSREGADKLGERLRSYGADGWELVSIVPFGGYGFRIEPIDIEGQDGWVYGHGGEGGGGGGTYQLMWVFKRPKTD